MNRRNIALTLIAIGAVAAAAYAVLRDRAPSEAELAAEGREVYAQSCASCHGDNLEGQPNWRQPLADGGLPAPPHDADGHTWHHPDDLLFTVVKFGGGANAPPGFKSNMPAFQDLLTDREIWASLAFIKSQWPPNIRGRQQRLSGGNP